MWCSSSAARPPRWTKRSIAKRTFDGAESVYAADVDGDGDVDVLGAAWADGEITWWENLGTTPPTWAEHTIRRDFNGACDVHATDLDGDGDTDVLGAANFENHIIWWENVTEADAEREEFVPEPGSLLLLAGGLAALECRIARSDLRDLAP